MHDFPDQPAAQLQTGPTLTEVNVQVAPFMQGFPTVHDRTLKKKFLVNINSKLSNMFR